MKPQIHKIPEILWLITAILAFAVAAHKSYAAREDTIQYFIISALAVLMYFYRKNKRTRT